MTTSRSFYAQRAPIFPSSANLMEPVDVELQSARCLFGEKVKELSVAVAKVDALTRQLEELRNGNTANSYQVVSGNISSSSSLKVSQEYEKLRKELLHRNKLIDSQNSELNFKKSLLTQKKTELLQIDDRIVELQQRLAKKKQLNQQQVQAQSQNKSQAISYSSLRSSIGAGFGGKKLLPIHVRQSGSNVAAVEPMQRVHHSSGDQVQNHVNIMRDVFLNKANAENAKFQTLPHNTKFNKTGLISSKGSTTRESLSESSPSVKSVTPVRGGGEASTVSIHVNGFGNDKEAEGRRETGERKVADAVDRQAAPDMNGSDWQKVRRRCVIVDDDMERALSAPMSHNSSPEPDSKLIHKTSSPGQRILLSTSGKLSPPPPVPPVCDRLQDLPHQEGTVILLKNRNDRRDENGNESLDSSHVPQTNCMNGGSLSDKTLPPASSSSSSSPSSSSPPSSASSRDDGKHASQDACIQQLNGWNKQSSKGNLKNSSHSQSNGNSEGRGLTRRVSFDPLALLLDAALEGELELVKKTACQVPDPSASKDEGLTALHNAICAGHFPVVRFLVEFGCDVNAQDSEGWTPLHCAASCNNLKMVEFLVEHGASVFATTLSDHETAFEKCDEEEANFDACSQYLFSIQERMGVVNGGVVYAVYDYDAQNSDELSFRDGDRVVIMRKGDDQEIDWWWARISDREGYVPRTLFALFPRVRPLRLDKLSINK